MNSHKPDELKDFSIVLGGPLYQFYQRTWLLLPPLELLKRRMFVVTMISWLPLLLLSMKDGVIFSSVQIPFIYDLDTHARFLVSLNLLIAAELFAHQLIGLLMQQFPERDLISSEEQPSFIESISSTICLRNSVVIELLLLVFVFTAGHWIWNRYSILDVTTWYSFVVDGKSQVSLAGYWYAFVSLPIFQFILMRWYFRIFIWYRFLWKISRLNLQLNSLHPDRAGGFGFMGRSVFAFAPVLLAHTILLSGMIANRIWHEGAIVTDFTSEIIAILFFLICLVFLPLTFFIPQMLRVKKRGVLSYGAIALRYVNDFRKKWIDPNLKDNKGMLGSSDIQSLADLSNSFQVQNGMGLMPFNHKTIILLIIIIALPLFPLVLTMIPLESILTKMISIIL
jgi:hypothetical protein